MQATQGGSVPGISSFLNLCRVCPVPSDDKVNSEYKRNFTWHDGYQSSKVEVVRNAPSLPTSAEPSLPRKKKCPGQGQEASSRDHLVYGSRDESESNLDSLETQSYAPSHERIPEEDGRNHRGPDESDSKKADDKPAASRPPPTPSGGPEEGPGPRSTSEYRAQFVAWPTCHQVKSASMGLITHAAGRTRDVVDGESAPLGDLWNALPADDANDAALDALKRGRPKKTEYKAKFRPFSAYTYVDGGWKKATRLVKESEPGGGEGAGVWYGEVVERLRRAEGYRARSQNGAPFYGAHTPDGPPFRDVLSPVSLPPSSRDLVDDIRPRGGSTKKKSSHVEKTTARPKSAEPAVHAGGSSSSREHSKSPKRRPRAPRDLPVKGHGDLSGRKKKQGGSPKAKRAHPTGDKVWLKPDSDDGQDRTMVNGFDGHQTMVNGDADHVVNGEYAGGPKSAVPARVPLTTVRSPEEVTGVRSPDPESWTVPLEVGRGLHWMNGETPDGGGHPKGPAAFLVKKLKESSLATTSHADIVTCNTGAEVTSGEGPVDL